MKNHWIKLITTLLACLTLCSFPLQTFAANDDSQIMPRYDNTDKYTATFSVADPGTAIVRVSYFGTPSTFTKAEITVKIQKRFLLVFWNDVDIGYTNNEWTATCTDQNGIFSKTFAVNGTGYYRAKITLKVYGSGGTVDVIESTREYQYK